MISIHLLINIKTIDNFIFNNLNKFLIKKELIFTIFSDEAIFSLSDDNIIYKKSFSNDFSIILSNNKNLFICNSILTKYDSNFNYIPFNHKKL